MSDQELLDWFERVTAQCWSNKVWGNDGKIIGRTWTVQAWPTPGNPVQPTRATLREALLAAKTAYEVVTIHLQ